MIRMLTAGESHGPQLTVIVDGLPAGLSLTAEDIDRDLLRRQQGHGRGRRMDIERDHVRFTGGVRHGRTIGAPVCMVIENRDWENWRGLMAPEPGRIDAKDIQTRPRPGHADLAGAQKYGITDLRDILERASARETAARVAAGAACRALLEASGVELFSFVSRIGSAAISPETARRARASAAERSPVRTVDPAAEKRMIAAIDAAAARGDTLGGVFTVVARDLPPGLGSHAQWDRRIDGMLAGALMSIQAVKAVGFGLGAALGELPGSQAHDAIRYGAGRGYYRAANRAGGVEGGMTNGCDLIIHCAMKPIPSLKRPLPSVDMRTRRPAPAAAVRSDVCAVPAAGVVGEAMAALVLAGALCEKFGGDSLDGMIRSLAAYRRSVRG